MGVVFIVTRPPLLMKIDQTGPTLDSVLEVFRTVSTQLNEIYNKGRVILRHFNVEMFIFHYYWNPHSSYMLNCGQIDIPIIKFFQ